MKTTVEMPDPLFRRAKATAAEQGVSLKEFFSAAVRDYLQRASTEATNGKFGVPAPAPRPAWMTAFGGLKHLHKETQRINHIIEKEFEQIDEDQWR
jgi:hypothetical protein